MEQTRQYLRRYLSVRLSYPEMGLARFPAKKILIFQYQSLSKFQSNNSKTQIRLRYGLVFAFFQISSSTKNTIQFPELQKYIRLVNGLKYL